MLKFPQLTPHSKTDFNNSRSVLYAGVIRAAFFYAI